MSNDLMSLPVDQILKHEDIVNKISVVLSEEMDVDRFMQLAITMAKRPELAKCTKISILEAVMQVAQWQLECDGSLGHAYLIPFRNSDKGVTECKALLGYRGKIALSKRTNLVSAIYAENAITNDEFRYSMGLEHMLDHKPTQDRTRYADSSNISHSYAVIRYKDGSANFAVMSFTEVDKIRQGSRGKDGKAWRYHYGEMAKKTAINRLLKNEDLSPELTRASAMEEAYMADQSDNRWSPEQADGHKKLLAKMKEQRVDIKPAEVLDVQTVEAEPAKKKPGKPSERDKMVAEYIEICESKGKVPVDTKGMDEDKLAEALAIAKGE